jgi:molecular chaperone GrpE
VVEEVQKGYLLHGKVLRPALVKVAKRPSVDDFAEV